MLRKLSPETLARISGQHPWITIGVWALILLLAIALIFGFLADTLTTEMNFTNNPESKQADDLLEKRLKGPKKANEIVIIKSEALTVDEPAFQEYVELLYQNLLALGSNIIAGGTHYYQTAVPSLVSADRHTTLMPFTMAGTLDDASNNFEKVAEVLRKANSEGGFQVFITGDATLGKDFERAAEKDLRTGELFGIPVAMVVLVLVFGAIATAVIPVVLALVAIVVALGATALVGQAFDLSYFVINMITMMGLAVGIDYSLFVVSRYREERRRGLAKLDSIAKAGATASRSVLFSGMTVVVALLGILFVPLTLFRSLGVGAILVVIAAVLATLTLLPAVLGLMGDKVNSWRLPLLQRRAGGRNGFWDRVTGGVMRRPVASLLVAAGLLIAAAIPFFDINIGGGGVSTLPDGLPSKEGFLVLDREFSAGLMTPTYIVIDGEVTSPPVQAALQRLQAKLKADAAFASPTGFVINPGGDLALLTVPVAGDYLGDGAITAVRRLRNNYIPRAFSGVQAKALVTGATAGNMDYFDLTRDYTPIVFAFVLGLSFLLLTVVFHSLVVPVKAIIMNLLSVGAAYGLLVLVFQKGVGASQLGFQHASAVEAWIPLFLFAVLFGLSMDYHVFLLSRIRERFNQTSDNSEAVAFGLRSTAGIITGAALIMVAVFGGFAAGDLLMFQQVGFGLTVAVFLDATIIRSVLVPTSMQLLGRRNWYLPSVLRWLPVMGAEKASSESVPVAATVSDGEGSASKHREIKPES